MPNTSTLKPFRSKLKGKHSTVKVFHRLVSKKDFNRRIKQPITLSVRPISRITVEISPTVQMKSTKVTPAETT